MRLTGGDQYEVATRGRGRARGTEIRGRSIGDGGWGSLRPMRGEVRGGPASIPRGRGRGRGDEGDGVDQSSGPEYPTIAVPAGPRLILGAKTLSASDTSQHGGDAPSSGAGSRCMQLANGADRGPRPWIWFSFLTWSNHASQARCRQVYFRALRVRCGADRRGDRLSHVCGSTCS